MVGALSLSSFIASVVGGWRKFVGVGEEVVRIFFYEFL